MLHSRQFPDFVIHTFVALAPGAPAETCTWIGSSGWFSLAQKYTQYAPILKTCGMFKSSLLGKLQDQVRGGFENGLVAGDLVFGKPRNVFPAIAGQPADRVVETILFVRFFQIDFYAAVLFFFGVHDFGAVVKL